LLHLIIISFSLTEIAIPFDDNYYFDDDEQALLLALMDEAFNLPHFIISNDANMNDFEIFEKINESVRE
jgi:hypothetical protein